MPAADIKRLFAVKPDIKGLAVPGMPLGSPGMEADRVEQYDVIAIKESGEATIFSRY